jgi:hypothetical protein
MFSINQTTCKRWSSAENKKAAEQNYIPQNDPRTIAVVSISFSPKGLFQTFQLV